MNDPKVHVVITGMPGAGKSTLARALQHRSGRPVRDSDPDIENLMGRTGAEIAADEGVARLHALEAAVLLGALADAAPMIITAAGSTIDNPTCRTAMARRAHVLHLVDEPARLLERMPTSAHRRPMTETELRRLLDKRSPLFERIADTLLYAALGEEAVAEAAVAALGW